MVIGAPFSVDLAEARRAKTADGAGDEAAGQGQGDGEGEQPTADGRVEVDGGRAGADRALAERAEERGSLLRRLRHGRLEAGSERADQRRARDAEDDAERAAEQ